MAVPDWWTTALLALACFRVYRLLAEDTVLDKPRARALRLSSAWNPGQPIPPGYRERVGEFMQCPWCLGFWLALAWWISWQIWPHGTTVVAVPFAISTVVGIMAKLDKGDE